MKYKLKYSVRNVYSSKILYLHHVYIQNKCTQSIRNQKKVLRRIIVGIM